MSVIEKRRRYAVMGQSLLQMNTIFISIIIEALPFIVLGVFISAVIQMFVTEEMIAKVMPKNRFLSIAFGTGMGALFPACECGIVPITERLVRKNVPLSAAIAFMLTGPIINPVVIFSTFVAFGDSWKMALLRCGLAIFTAVLTAIAISYFFPKTSFANLWRPNCTTTGMTTKHMINRVFCKKSLVRSTMRLMSFFLLASFSCLAA